MPAVSGAATKAGIASTSMAIVPACKPCSKASMAAALARRCTGGDFAEEEEEEEERLCIADCRPARRPLTAPEEALDSPASPPAAPPMLGSETSPLPKEFTDAIRRLSSASLSAGMIIVASVPSWLCSLAISAIASAVLPAR